MTISPKAIYAHDNSRIAQFSMFNELVEIKNLGEVSFKNIIFVIYRGFMHIMSEYPMRILGKLNEKFFAVLENVSTTFLCYMPSISLFLFKTISLKETLKNLIFLGFSV